MIRVLQMLGSLEAGGAQAVVINIYRNINKKNIQFDFIVDHKEKLFYASEIEKLGGKIYYLPQFYGWNIFKVIRAWENLFSEHREYNILHVHLGSYARIFIGIAKIYGLKVIYHSHTADYGKGFKGLLRRVFLYKVQDKCDYLFSCSKEAAYLQYGSKYRELKNYFYFPNAIDVNKFIYNPAYRNKYRKKYNWENKFVYVHVGRFTEAKNHNFLIELFAFIHKNDQNTCLVLIGEGELKNSIIEKVDKMNLNDSVCFLGNREDVNCLLSAMDCFLFPSLWEGLPVSVIEAQANGLICLISDKITKDVKITDLITYLPLNQGFQVWIDALKCMKIYNRIIYNRMVANTEFNIYKSTLWLEKFYQNINNS